MAKRFFKPLWTFNSFPLFSIKYFSTIFNMVNVFPSFRSVTVSGRFDPVCSGQRLAAGLAALGSDMRLQPSNRFAMGPTSDGFRTVAK